VEKTTKDGIFFLIRTTRATKKLLYDKDTQLIDTVTTDDVIATRQELSLFTVFLCVSILSMAISNIHFVVRGDNSTASPPPRASFASLAAIDAAVSTVFFAPLAAIASPLAVSFASLAAFAENKGFYVGASVAFYIFSFSTLLFYFIA
jgi:hypothetical protein